MRASLKTEKKMEKESIFIIIEAVIKDIGKKINFMDKVFYKFTDLTLL